MAQTTPQEWFAAGLNHHAAARYDEAIQAFNQAIQRNYQPVTAVMMRIARAQSMKNNGPAALDMLQNAADNGFANLVLLQNDNDFAVARNDPRWGKILRQVDLNGKPCLTDRRYRTLDFWIGDWAVTNFGNGAPAGENDVHASLDGCLIIENWTPSNGNRGRGKSLNFFDATTERWRQVYITDTGTVLDFTGEPRDGAMHFTRNYQLNGRRIQERMVFTPLEGGDVHQNWELSPDDGRTWQPLLNGRYIRKRQ